MLFCILILYQTVGNAKIHGMMVCSSHGRGVRLKGYNGYRVLSDCCKPTSIVIYYQVFTVHNCRVEIDSTLSSVSWTDFYF